MFSHKDGPAKRTFAEMGLVSAAGISSGPEVTVYTEVRYVRKIYKTEQYSTHSGILRRL